MIDLKQKFLKRGIDIIFRKEDFCLWDKTIAECKYIPYAYENASINYQLAYQQGICNIVDLSSVLLWGGRAVGVWPNSCRILDRKAEFNSFGQPLFPPLLGVGCNDSIIKKINKICIEVSIEVWFELHQDIGATGESFANLQGITEWHLELVRRNFKPEVFYELYVNLSLPEDEIKRKFRSSYKSLINIDKYPWNYHILTSIDENIWNKFKALHYTVAGRETRSSETWKMHLNDIANSKGLLIALCNDAGEMDGAGFFNFSRDEGGYSVGVYKRELFSMPLGHLIQFKAIQELKSRGIKWYKIGPRSFKSDSTLPTDKELSIADFKHGFASHVYPKYIMKNNILFNN
jgi:FemAB family protein